MESNKQQVAIVLYPEVEVLDVAGPAEVFSSQGSYNVYSLAQTLKPVRTANGLSLMPDDTFHSRIKPDIVIVPGGNSLSALNNTELLQGVKALSIRANLILSVCTGALLLAKAGLLDGCPATTYHTAYKQLKSLAPTCEVVTNQRFVDCGRIITTAGVSAGIDGALHIIQRHFGQQEAEQVASQIEYPHWQETVGQVRISARG